MPKSKLRGVKTPNRKRTYKPRKSRTFKPLDEIKGPPGRPEKLDKDLYSQITCILRKDTIEQLRQGAGGKFFGEFLQAHLDRFPLPTRKQYLATTVKHKKLPVIMAYGLSRDAKRLAREQARRETLSPKERAWEDSIREGVTRVVQQAYANQS